MHPLNNYRIYDATSFLLQLRRDDLKLLKEKDPSSPFAPYYKPLENTPNTLFLTEKDKEEDL